MFNLFHAVVLGIVEGLTEFLPVSSTAHMTLVASLLHIQQTDFVKNFEIIIQLGAILAVLVLYWQKLLINIEILKRVVVAFIPTGTIGLALYKIIKKYLLGNLHITIWALIIGGVIMVAFEVFKKEGINDISDITTISYKQCLAIGLWQSLAIIPGVSRSGATILGGLSMNIKRRTIVEFSFLLAVPTMFGATGLDLLESRHALASEGHFGYLAIGFLVAFVVAMVSIKFLLNYIKNHDFKSFGFYRIVVGILFLLLGNKVS